MVADCLAFGPSLASAPRRGTIPKHRFPRSFGMHQVAEGIWVPIVTPFRRGEVDGAALARLARHLQAHGVAGLVAGATTGEGALLTPAEQEGVFTSLREAVPKLPVVLGLSQAATSAAVERARVLAALRPHGLLVTPPPYLRPGRDGVRRRRGTHVPAGSRNRPARVLGRRQPELRGPLPGRPRHDRRRRAPSSALACAHVRAVACR